MEPDEFEHIPWSNLMAEHRSQRTKLLYLVAGVIVAVVVGFVAVRWLSGPQHGEASSDAPQATVAADGVQPAVEVTPREPPPSPAGTLREADLRAGGPSFDAAELARLRAEWFVTDYFTVDGSPTTAADVAGSFVSDAVVPPLPHEAGDDAMVSFVEWARAYRTVALDRELYMVDVAFRSIHSTEDGAFRRGAVHAVSVAIAVRDGLAAVAELPVPVAPPHAGELTGWWSGTPASEDVGAAVVDYGLLFDGDPELIEATEAGGEWRGVLMIGDGSGIRWPVAVRSDRLLRE